MAVLVTGGGGMIGARIVRKVLERGEAVVSADVTADQSRLDGYAGDATLTRIACDVRDGDGLLSVMRNYGVDRVIHMAAMLVPGTEQEPASGFAVNITGTTNVFEAARHVKAKRVCYASSTSTYGDQSVYGDLWVDEDSARHPYSLYGYAKLINEETAKAYTRNFGLDMRGLRIATVLGHGRITGRSSAISRVISAVAVGEAGISDVAGGQAAPVLYVDDVAECMVRLLFAEGLDRPVYAGMSQLVTVAEAFDIARRYLPDAEIGYTDDAVTYQGVEKMNAARLEQAIDYRAPPLERRILDHINEARAERQLPPIEPT